MRHYQAVIFDMDGVLLDSEPLHFQALNEVLGRAGYQLTAHEYEELIGVTLEETWRRLIERFDLRERLDVYAARYDEAVLTILRRPLDPSPGVVTLLEALREASVPLALASSSKRNWIAATLHSLGVADYFPIVVSGDDVARGKPDPEIFLLTARKLGLPPEQCVVIEDSPHGVTAASRAGMRTIAVRTPYTAHLPLPEADLIVDSLVGLDLAALDSAPWPAR